MAVFQYQALTQAGRLMKGTLEAGSPSEASDLLSQMELTVQSVEKTVASKAATPIGRNEFVLFNQQLASIAKAGIPLERGLRELSHDIASPKMRRLIEEIATDLEAGMDIQEAFEKRQRDLPPLYGRILKAGVLSVYFDKAYIHCNIKSSVALAIIFQSYFFAKVKCLSLMAFKKTESINKRFI